MYSNNRPLRESFVRPTLALACLGLGTIGLVLPLIPGIPLLIVGALLLRRDRRRAAALPHTGALSGAERLQLQFWLLARHITTTAESIRLARRQRTRARQRDL